MSDFVENNQKLISVLGIFTALAAFANSIPIKEFGHLLPLPCLGIVILLWFEVLRRMPSWDDQEIPLTIFSAFLLLVVLIVTAYWLVEYRDFWRQLIPAVLLVVLLGVVASPIGKLRKRIESGNRFREFATRNVRLSKVIPHAWLLSLLVLTWVAANLLSLPLIRLLDRIDEGITKSKFAENREKEFPIQFEFMPGKYCCYKAQAASTTCHHTCCVLARIDGTFCTNCVPKGSAVLKPKIPPVSSNPSQASTNNTGTVTITIDGADSEIFVDGSFVGNGSAKLPLFVGKHAN